MFLTLLLALKTVTTFIRTRPGQLGPSDRATVGLARWCSSPPRNHPPSGIIQNAEALSGLFLPSGAGKQGISGAGRDLLQLDTEKKIKKRPRQVSGFGK
jgi:hypothetical protein